METVECPSCKLPIVGVTRGEASGWNESECPFCGHVIVGHAKENVSQGAVIGWRGVLVRDVAGRPRIYSPAIPAMTSFQWKPGETAIATCGGVPLEKCKHRAAGDKAPVPSCTCGFYAARTREHLMRLGYNCYSSPDDPDHYIVQVEQFGRVVVASNGFRAERCRIKTIYVPADGSAWKRAAMLQEDYGVEVEIADTLNLERAAYPKWCEACMAKMSGRSFTCEWCEHTHTYSEAA